jgi:hypothetical protein
MLNYLFFKIKNINFIKNHFKNNFFINLLSEYIDYK